MSSRRREPDGASRRDGTPRGGTSRDVTRRGFLGIAAAGALAGCGIGGSVDHPNGAAAVTGA